MCDFPKNSNFNQMNHKNKNFNSFIKNISKCLKYTKEFQKINFSYSNSTIGFIDNSKYLEEF